MDFEKVSHIASLLAKNFTRDFLRLLVIHHDISASEAASKLDLHIRTSQDFLEGLFHEGIVGREEVIDGKRPYFRYKLRKEKIEIDLDLNSLYDFRKEANLQGHAIRERKNNTAIFYTPSNQNIMSSVTVFTGDGRNRKERKISLTKPQGKFLFHLPFPNSDHLGIKDIMNKAELPDETSPEIIEIVKDLIKFGVIEKNK